MAFYLSWSESEIHADIRNPIKKYIFEETGDSIYTLDQIKSSYIIPITRIESYDLSKIGSHQAIGNKVRLTYRLYNANENDDLKTKDKFP